MIIARTENARARRTSLRSLLAAIGALALAGWIWSLSNVHIPGALWLVTVALTLVFIVLLAYGVVRRARRS